MFIPPNHKVRKVGRFLQALMENAQKVWNLGEHVFIDEQVVLCNSRKRSYASAEAHEVQRRPDLLRQRSCHRAQQIISKIPRFVRSPDTKNRHWRVLCAGS